MSCLYYIFIFIFGMKCILFLTAVEFRPIITKTLLNLRPKFWMCHRSLQQWKHFKICPSPFPVKKIWPSSTPPSIRTFPWKRAPVPTPTTRRDGSPTSWSRYAGQSALFSEWRQRSACLTCWIGRVLPSSKNDKNLCFSSWEGLAKNQLMSDIIKRCWGFKNYCIFLSSERRRMCSGALAWKEKLLPRLWHKPALGHLY